MATGPNLFISAKIAAATGDEAACIKNRTFPIFTNISPAGSNFRGLIAVTVAFRQLRNGPCAEKELRHSAVNDHPILLQLGNYQQGMPLRFTFKRLFRSAISATWLRVDDQRLVFVASFDLVSTYTLVVGNGTPPRQQSELE